MPSILCLMKRVVGYMKPKCVGKCDWLKSPTGEMICLGCGKVIKGK